MGLIESIIHSITSKIASHYNINNNQIRLEDSYNIHDDNIDSSNTQRNLSVLLQNFELALPSSSASRDEQSLSNYLISRAAEIVVRQRFNEFNQNLVEQLQELIDLPTTPTTRNNLEG